MTKSDLYWPNDRLQSNSGRLRLTIVCFCVVSYTHHCAACRLFVAELPHLQDSFVDKLLELMPRLSSCKPVELVKILQTTLRQSGLLQLKLPDKVSQPAGWKRPAFGSSVG